MPVISVSSAILMFLTLVAGISQQMLCCCWVCDKYPMHTSRFSDQLSSSLSKSVKLKHGSLPLRLAQEWVGNEQSATRTRSLVALSSTALAGGLSSKTTKEVKDDSIWAHELSFAAARAFQTMDASMVVTNEEMLSILGEVKATVNRIVDIASNNGVAGQGRQVQPTQVPLKTTQTPFATQDENSNTATMPSSPKSDFENFHGVAQRRNDSSEQREKASQLSMAAAVAIGYMNDNVSRKDATALAILHEVSDSLRKIVASNADVASSTASTTVQTASPKATPLSHARILLEQKEVKHASITRDWSRSLQHDSKSTRNAFQFEKALLLSIAATEALANAEMSMVKNDAKAFTILLELRDTLRALAAAMSDKAVSKLTEPEPTLLERTKSSPQPMPQQVVATNVYSAAQDELASSPKLAHISNWAELQLQNAVNLSIAAAQAFDAVNENMATNDAAVLDIFHELKRSVQNIPSYKSQLVSAVEPDVQKIPVHLRIQPVHVHPVLAEPPSKRDEVTPAVASNSFITQEYLLAVDLSVAAAHAFDVGNENMVENDAALLGMLHELNESIQHFSSSETQLVASADQVVDAAPFQVTIPLIDDFQEPANQVPEEISAVASYGISGAPYQELQNAVDISIAAAAAFALMNENMASKAAATLEILHDLKESMQNIQKIPSSDHHSVTAVQPFVQAAPKEVSPPPAPAHQVSVKTAFSPKTTKIPSVTNMGMKASAEEKLEDSIGLSTAAAQSFNILSQNMIQNDSETLEILNELRGYFLNLATLDETINSEPSEVSMQVDFQLGPSEIQPLPPSFLLPESLTAPEEISSTTVSSISSSNDQELKNAVDISIAAAQAFTLMDENMASKAAATLEILHDLKESMQQIPSSEGSSEGHPNSSVQPVVQAAPMEVSTRAGQVHQISVKPAFSQEPMKIAPVTNMGMKASAKHKLQDSIGLSTAAAQSFSILSLNMIQNDSEALGILHELRGYFLKLATLQNEAATILDTAVTSAPTEVPTQVDFQFEPAKIGQAPEPFPLPESLPSPEEILSLTAIGITISADEDLQDAVELSTAAAEAFNAIDMNMATKAADALKILHDLKASIHDIPSSEQHIVSVEPVTPIKLPIAPVEVLPEPALVSDAVPVVDSAPKEVSTPAAAAHQKNGEKTTKQVEISSSTVADIRAQYAMGLSMEVAQAFKNRDKKNAVEDAKVVEILHELKSSVQELAALGAEALTRVEPAVTPFPWEASLPLLKPNPEAPADAAPQEIGKEICSPVSADHQLQHAVELSKAAAQAFDVLDEQMSMNDAEALEILLNMKGSVQRLDMHVGLSPLDPSGEGVRVEVYPGQVESAECPGQVNIPTATTLEASFLPSQPKSEEFASSIVAGDVRLAVSRPPSTSSAADQLRCALDLSVASADAFNNLDDNLATTFARTLEILQELNSPLKKLSVVATTFSTAPAIDKSTEESTQGHTLTLQATHGLSDSVKPVSRERLTCLPSPRVDVDGATYQEALCLSLAIAGGLADLDAEMNHSDSMALAQLSELSDSLKALLATGDDSRDKCTTIYPEAKESLSDRARPVPNIQEQLGFPLIGKNVEKPAMPDLVSGVADTSAENVAIVREKALQFSIHAAAALDDMAENINESDKVVLQILDEINGACKKMTSEVSKLTAPLIQSTDKQTETRSPVNSVSRDLLSPVAEVDYVSAMASIKVFSLERGPCDKENALLISTQASAMLADMTHNMDTKFQETLDVLHDIRLACRQLVPSGSQPLPFAPPALEYASAVSQIEAGKESERKPQEGKRGLSLGEIDSDSSEAPSLLAPFLPALNKSPESLDISYRLPGRAPTRLTEQPKRYATQDASRSPVRYPLEDLSTAYTFKPVHVRAATERSLSRSSAVNPKEDLSVAYTCSGDCISEDKSRMVSPTARALKLGLEVMNNAFVKSRTKRLEELRELRDSFKALAEDFGST